MNNPDLRLIALQKWLQTALPGFAELQLLPSGAGTRRYFRVANAGLIVMDAANDQKCTKFIQFSQAFHALGVSVPVIHAADLQQGFLLLTDFGDNLYGRILHAENADDLYQHAFTALLRIQAYPTNMAALAPFDMAHYHEKMGWFDQFYYHQYLRLTLSARQQRDYQRLLDKLIDTAQRQPAVCVHYDYHCRNIIQLPDQRAGILDFQDAVSGPVTYDLMSLLRDCYLDWPLARVQGWLRQYHQAALMAGIIGTEDPLVWQRWCDFSSVQRHLKCIGLFARFHILNYSADYLQYIPRSLRYLRDIAPHYPEMAILQELLKPLLELPHET